MIGLRVCTILSIALLGNGAWAQTNDEKYTSLCIENDGTGFNWSNGGWRTVQFREERFIFRKIDRKEDALRPDKERLGVTCWDSIDSYEPTVYGNFGWRDRCYILHDLGKEPTLAHAMKCTEYLNVRENGEESIKSVDCPTIKAKPNGSFHKVFWHGNLSENPKDDYKDSLKISHGQCSVID